MAGCFVVPYRRKTSVDAPLRMFFSSSQDVKTYSKVSRCKNKLVWMNGPFRAGQSDNSIFKKKGLKAKLVSIGKRGIGDGNYTGSPHVMSSPNNHDSAAVKMFKSRALKRHEKFNGMIKHFDCLIGRFRHSATRFQQCVEAVCVICQYKMEMGNPLFDILIEAVVQA